MSPKDDTTDAVTIAAESDKKKKDDEKKNKLKKSEEELKEDSMSEEDKELKERLETCVSTVTNEKNEVDVTIPIRLTALDVIVNELRTATASMTSVPKPLKFLRPCFPSLKTLYLSLGEQDSASMDKEALEFRARLADIVAVLAMTMSKPGKILFIHAWRPGYRNISSVWTHTLQICWNESPLTITHSHTHTPHLYNIH